MFGFFLTCSQSVRAKKRKKKNEKQSIFLHRQNFIVCLSKFSLFESQSGQPFKKCSTPRFFKCILSEVNVHCRNFRNESVSMLKHSKMNKKRNTKCPSRRPKLQLALPTFCLKRVNFNLCFTCLKWQLLFHCFHFFANVFFSYVLFLVLHTPFSTWGFF